MAAISQTIFSELFSWMKLLFILIEFVPKCSIDNKQALFQVMAWRRTGDKPLPEPIFTQFTGAYIGH